MIFAQTAYTPPTSLDICLCTATPVTTGNGSIVEPNTSTQYIGYARVTVASNNTNWPAAAAGAISNGTAITFPMSSGGASSPVTVTYVAALDHATGRVIAFAPLPGGTTVASGQTPQFAVSALVWTIV